MCRQLPSTSGDPESLREPFAANFRGLPRELTGHLLTLLTSHDQEEDYNDVFPQSVETGTLLYPTIWNDYQETEEESKMVKEAAGRLARAIQSNPNGTLLSPSAQNARDALLLARARLEFEASKPISTILWVRFQKLWARVEAEPYSYVLKPDEMSLFVWFQGLFPDPRLARMAMKRYWETDQGPVVTRKDGADRGREENLRMAEMARNMARSTCSISPSHL